MEAKLFQLILGFNLNGSKIMSMKQACNNLVLLNLIDYDIEVSGGTPYSYFHVWQNVSLSGSGVIRKLLE